MCRPRIRQGFAGLRCAKDEEGLVDLKCEYVKWLTPSLNQNYHAGILCMLTLYLVLTTDGARVWLMLPRALGWVMVGELTSCLLENRPFCFPALRPEPPVLLQAILGIMRIGRIGKARGV